MILRRQIPFTGGVFLLPYRALKRSASARCSHVVTRAGNVWFRRIVPLVRGAGRTSGVFVPARTPDTRRTGEVVTVPAVASLEDLRQVQNELESLRMKDEEIYQDFVELFQRNRSVGYKNICKLLMGETTPEELKGVE